MTSAGSGVKTYHGIVVLVVLEIIVVVVSSNSTCSARRRWRRRRITACLAVHITRTGNDVFADGNVVAVRRLGARGSRTSTIRSTTTGSVGAVDIVRARKKSRITK